MHAMQLYNAYMHGEKRGRTRERATYNKSKTQQSTMMHACVAGYDRVAYALRLMHAHAHNMHAF